MPTVFKVRSNISNTTMVGNEVMVCPTAQRNLVLTIRFALSNKGFEFQKSAVKGNGESEGWFLTQKMNARDLKLSLNTSTYGRKSSIQGNDPGAQSCMVLAMAQIVPRSTGSCRVLAMA